MCVRRRRWIGPVMLPMLDGGAGVCVRLFAFLTACVGAVSPRSAVAPETPRARESPHRGELR